MRCSIALPRKPYRCPESFFHKNEAKTEVLEKKIQELENKIDIISNNATTTKATSTINIKNSDVDKNIKWLMDRIYSINDIITDKFREYASSKGWAKKFKCTGEGNKGGGCGAVLLVEQDDIFYTYSNHYDGSSETYCTFQCPQCQVLTDLPRPDAYSLPFKPHRRNPNKPSRD
jgi:hypothetical protein